MTFKASPTRESWMESSKKVENQKNQKRLIELKKKYGFSHEQLASITFRSVSGVSAWFCDIKSSRYRAVGDDTLRLIEIEGEKIKNE